MRAGDVDPARAGSAAGLTKAEHEQYTIDAIPAIADGKLTYGGGASAVAETGSVSVDL